MKVEYIQIKQRSLIEVLKPQLIGHVFHVTSHEVANLILQGESLLPNEQNERPSGFGPAAPGYFRNRGCISLFDFRNPSDEGLDNAFYFASALNPGGKAKNRPAFLFLDASLYGDLIPYTAQHVEMALHETIVPQVECGHKGAIRSEQIINILFVTVIPTPNPIWDAI